MIGLASQEECYRLMLSKGANHDLQVDDCQSCCYPNKLLLFNKKKVLAETLSYIIAQNT